MQHINKKNINEFDSVSLTLASPEIIKEWSHGEVTKPETINYRTQRSEKNGLFDEKIFGPDRDYECYCGKYRGVRYKGIICEKCGVEITRAIVRRERMGHIDLATPVSHIWFLRSMPSRISMILGMSSADVEKVIYFAGYIITEVSEDERARILKEVDSEFKTKIKTLQDQRTKDELKDRLIETKKDIDSIRIGRVIDEVTYHNFSVKYSTLFEAEIGAEAVYNLCKNLDLKALIKELRQAIEKSASVEADKMRKRLSLLESMNANELRPEWMFLTRIPIIPPAVRPMVPLDGGRYATSDVNDLYRRVINRNNRLRRLKDIGAPEVILRNEKRILQEAVDSLIDNSIRQGGTQAAQSSQQRRPLKSLADNLKGKRGLFRSNLLGKRVDYSGRSVIIVGADLSLDQCGLPKHMALELFKPFVISKLLSRELAFNIRGASKLIEDGIPEVWAILEEVIEGKYVLLNRAPTLHRLGIQAFRPVLIEGNAVQVHPLICPAFNADFDGDQMAVHVPLSEKAQIEAREIMASNKNILKPGSGESIITSKLLDILLGCYWVTKVIEGKKGEGKVFESPNGAVTAYNFNDVDLRAKIRVLPADTQKYEEFEGKLFETTTGRIMFNEILPEDYPFFNKEVDRKAMSTLVDDLVSRYGIEQLPEIVDRIKDFGFYYATHSGTTWGLDEVRVPEGKEEVIEAAKKEAEEIIEQYNEGLLSEEEKFRKTLEVWHGAKQGVEELIPASLNPTDSVYDLVHSGARGSMSQITIMAGMKGLIQGTGGRTIEFPILSSSKEGLTPIEYFITTHGSRKGMTDTALQTAKAGYLTRRLFDVGQDAIVTEKDCGTKKGITIRRQSASGIESSIDKSIWGRYLAEDVIDKDGNKLFKKGEYLTRENARLIEETGVNEVVVRSPLSCKTLRGLCVKCYGVDLGRGTVVDLGETVGTVAAQAIGEPGTQLTMRTFHAGGAASRGGDIVQGLPRVEEVFEKRRPKNPAVVIKEAGVISDIETTDRDLIVTVLTDATGTKKTKKRETVYKANANRSLLFKKGEQVEKGEIITDGSVNIDELFKHAGQDKTAEYIIREISKVYQLQGESVSPKHIEVIVRQMFSRLKVKEVGGTALSWGEIVEASEFEKENDQAKERDDMAAKALPVVTGITEVSLSRKSFLSAASFQHTTRVLINASTRGTKDKLVGLKENVIIGRLIPAGTGFEGSRKAQMLEDLSEKESEIEEE